MDGVHDLGGKQGFGPIEVTETFDPFQAEWEERLWAVCETTGAEDWTVDWFRFLVELLDPITYMNMPYFEKWFMAYATGFVMSGVFTEEEFLTAISKEKSQSPEPLEKSGVIEGTRALGYTCRREVNNKPRFTVGDRVRTIRYGKSGHTRLPAYGRDCEGVIVSHHGAHVFADTNVDGVEAPEHLYTIRFSACELWGDEASPKDMIHMEVWEPYLV